jgi:acyl-CoA synthetase (AMP-forming)/AMP-acid ligase II
VLTPADVDAVARSRLSGYKCPRRIDIVAELPKNPSGKIQKSEIRRRARGRFPLG